MGKQHLEQVTVETLRPKEYRWKLGARLRYVREKKYVSGGKQKKLITGIIEGEHKQLKFNIWSDKVSVEQLQPNATYNFSRGKLEDGVINLHDWSVVEPLEDKGEFPAYKTYSIHYLMEFPDVYKIIDFQGCILQVGEVQPGTTKEGRPYSKQQLECGDTYSRLKITVTMWDNFLSKTVEGYRCTFEGFKYKIYCGSQQLNSTVFSKIHTNLTEKKINVEEVLAEGHWHNLSELYRERTLLELKEKLSNSEPHYNVYSEVIAYLTDYIGDECFQEVCPTCSSKLEEDEMQLVCLRCGKFYPQGERRMLMRFNLQDPTESIKVKTYNYLSGKLLESVGCTLTSEELRTLNREQLWMLLQPLFHRRLRMRLVSNIIVYDETRFENHSIKQIFF